MGLVVTSNKAGYTDKSIFFPGAGYRDGAYLHIAGFDGNYWSSSLYTDNPSYAWYVQFVSDCVYVYDYDRYGSRYYGYSVRPVTE